MSRPSTYGEAGVSLSKAEAVVERLRAAVESTRTERVEGSVGAFAGLFALDDDRLLAATTDGVGTKLILARRAGRLFDAGVDLAAHCANDLLTVGAALFLDYVASAALDLAEVAELVAGAASVCREVGCAILGGETAELPGIYRDDELDFAGTMVGLVARADLVDGSRCRPGDAVLGLPSSGLHANGFTLVRRLVGNDDFDPTCCSVRHGCTWRTCGAAQRLRRPGARPRDRRRHSRKSRAPPGGLGARIEPEAGSAPRSSHGWTSTASRKTSSGGSSTSASGSAPSSRPRMRRRRLRRDRTPRRGDRRRHLGRLVIGVLVSGRGSNLQALIDEGLPIAAVASNVAGAASRGPPLPGSHRRLPAKGVREPRGARPGNGRLARGAGCGAGGLRGVHAASDPGVPRAPHRDQRPSFPPARVSGDDADRGRPGCRRRETGVTVHFVDEGVDSGPVIFQEAVPVEPEDTAETLRERAHAVEHRLLPEAARLYLAGALRS